MSFDLFLGAPYLTGVEIPPPGSTPDLPFSASAGSTSGSYRAETHLNPGRGITTLAARVGKSFIVPGGCTRILFTFKYWWQHYTSSWIVPGPGFVSASVGLDYIILRRRPSRGIIEVPISPARNVLAHIWVPALNWAHTGIYTVENHPESVILNEPTEEGEMWQIFLRAYAETGGWGFFVAGALATINGGVHGFRIVGN